MFKTKYFINQTKNLQAIYETERNRLLIGIEDALRKALYNRYKYHFIAGYFYKRIEKKLERRYMQDSMIYYEALRFIKKYGKEEDLEQAKTEINDQLQTYDDSQKQRLEVIQKDVLD